MKTLVLGFAVWLTACVNGKTPKQDPLDAWIERFDVESQANDWLEKREVELRKLADIDIENEFKALEEKLKEPED